MKLLKGGDLTPTQKSDLDFNGMDNPAWVSRHAFYFDNGKPADVNSGFYYPVCNPSDGLLKKFNS